MLRSFVLSLFTLFIFTGATESWVPVYREVVEAEACSLDQLRRGTVAYLEAVDQEKPKRHRGQWRANADSTQFVYDSDFLLYNRKSVKHPLGEITYRTTIDLKEGRFRYVADSAFFQQYRRDRYSRYVPARNASVAWEQARPNFSKKEQQRVFIALDTRFQSFKKFVHAQTQLAPTSPTADNW